MTNEVSSHQSNMFTFWRELQAYLKTEIEIVPSKASTGINLSDINLHKDENIKVKITVNNTAPDCIDVPKIVFIEPHAPNLHIFSQFPLPRLGTLILGTMMKGRGWDTEVFVEDFR